MAGVSEAVRDDLSAIGADIGYRRIHGALKSKKYICTREAVRQIVKQVDSDGVKLRKLAP